MTNKHTASAHRADGSGPAATPSAHPISRGEIRALTGLRIVAAMWVLVFHLQSGLRGTFGTHIDPFMPVIQAGWLGVDLFFVLSGFVMALTYLDTMGSRVDARRIGVFLWARLSRVWPLWILLTVLFSGWLLLTDHGLNAPPDRQRIVTLWGLVEQLFMVQVWHRESIFGATYVQPGWSLSVEFLAYVAFPLVVLVLWRLRRLPAAVLAVLAVGVMAPLGAMSFAGNGDFDIPWILRIAGAFVAGGLVCLTVRRMGSSPVAERWGAFVAAFAVVEILVVCYWGSVRSAGEPGIYVGVSALFFPVLVGALAVAPPRGVAGFLGRETMVLGGKISFALYLVHSIVFEVFDDLAKRVPQIAHGTALWSFMQPVLIVVSVLAAWLLWRFVEEPARKWMRRIGPQGSKRGVVAASEGHFVTVGPAEVLGMTDTMAPPRTAVPSAPGLPVSRRASLPPLPHEAPIRSAVPEAQVLSRGPGHRA
ncbi:acyltransferase family protein [Blastococcus sp. SYSU D00820]